MSKILHPFFGLVLVIFLMGFSRIAYSQDVTMVSGTYFSCDGSLLDTGGGGANYSDGENSTVTICPSTPGDVVTVDFIIFDLDNDGPNNQWDYLEIYDGENTTGSYLGYYEGNALQGLYVTGTSLNTSGCLTFVFHSNNDGQTGNIAANITCSTPCDRPEAAGTSSVASDNRICVGDVVTFDGSASFAAPGFSITEYLWDFADGTTDNSGAVVSHQFNEPGEYIIELFLTDDNDCASTNRISLQVLVATYPEFDPITPPSTLCLGEAICMEADPEQYEVTWNGPEITYSNPTDTTWADVVGECYPSTIEVEGFAPGQTLDNINDLISVGIVAEHSWLWDLLITLTCPSGQSVILHQQMLLPDGTSTTANGDDLGIPNTEQWSYFWSPTATQGTWSQAASIQPGTSLEEGTYNSLQPFENLLGCDLNGTWTIEICDLWGGDDGTMSEFLLEFNPGIIPDVTEFTPQIGGDADSSFWSIPAGNYDITYFSTNADTLCFLPTAGGVIPVSYSVVNSFGCTTDTTINITVNELPPVTAGPDQLFSCGAVQLEGGLNGAPSPSCGSDAGIFNYCYDDGENFTWTFCPDNPGDGITFMTFTFISGIMEAGFEDFIVYDGDNTSAPILEFWSGGDATGMSWTATNPTGCITIAFTSDGSISCGWGSYTEWVYEVSCAGSGPVYTWEWTPATFLNDTTVPNPTVDGVSQNTVYTLTAYPVGHPDCALSDDVVVSIDPLGDPGLDANLVICSTDAPFSMLSALNGTPVNTGVWLDTNGNPLPDDIFDPANDLPGNYTHSVAFGNCEAHATLNIAMALPTQIEISDDVTVCEFEEVSYSLIDQNFGQDPFSYDWHFDAVSISNSDVGGVFTPDSTGTLCLDVTDGCGYVASDCMNVVVVPAVDVVFESDTLAQCWPAGFNLTSLVDPALYNSIQWTVSDGTTATDTETLPVLFVEPGVYDVSLSVTNFLGCSYSTTYEDYLTSYSPPVAGFDPDPQPTDATQTEIHFTDESLGDIVTYQWLFGYPILGASTFQNPIFTFPIGVGAEYPVTLTITDIHGCTDDVSAIVDIDDIFQIYVPNSFTPNYDGINDVFFFKGADIDETRFSMKIFNRWGDIVYQTTDIHDPWTGDVHGGEYFAADGAYNWIALVTSKSTGEKYELSGIVNIIR